MSQFKIATKKDSMRKTKKSAMNIVIQKERLALRLEVNQDLGSLREEENRCKSETRRDVFQRFSFKAEEIDGYIHEDKSLDDYSSVSDGMMREVAVGTGLSGALKLLREQGTFKEKESKLSSVMYNHEDDIIRDGFKEIQIERVDQRGRILTQREAFRSLSLGFHGKKPGKGKQEKRKKKQKDQSNLMESSDRAVERLRQVHAKLKTPYIIL